MSGGSAGSAYAAEISALQTYQKQILSTLDTLVADQAAMTVVGALSFVTGSGANNGLGTFPEATQLSQTYSGVMQSLMTNFQEISALVTAMATALGPSAQNYLETENQITDSFNQIVQKYESKSGGFSTPGSPTPTAPTGTGPQSGTSNSYYTAASATNPNSSTTTSTSAPAPAPSGSGSGSSTGSIGQDNNANASNDTSSEE